MNSWQLVLLTFISMWIMGEICGASHFQNLTFAIPMTVAIAINENMHKLILNKIYRALSR